MSNSEEFTIPRIQETITCSNILTITGYPGSASDLSLLAPSLFPCFRAVCHSRRFVFRRGQYNATAGGCSRIAWNPAVFVISTVPYTVSGNLRAACSRGPPTGFCKRRPPWFCIGMIPRSRTLSTTTVEAHRKVAVAAALDRFSPAF